VARVGVEADLVELKAVELAPEVLQDDAVLGPGVDAPGEQLVAPRHVKVLSTREYRQARRGVIRVNATTGTVRSRSGLTRDRRDDPLWESQGGSDDEQWQADGV
jgi:hypothetical protein